MVWSIRNERWVVVVGMVLFSVPAIVHAAGLFVDIPSSVAEGLFVFVFVGVAVYWRLTMETGPAARTATGDAAANGDPNRLGDDPDLIATNYEGLLAQAEYRDKLLINANYFSLVILAALINAFLRTDPELRPLIAMVGAVTAFAFWLATESYKGSRDELNAAMRAIEDRHVTEFSVVSTYDDRDRSAVGKRSLSSYLIGIQTVATLLWTAVYLVYVLYLGFY